MFDRVSDNYITRPAYLYQHSIDFRISMAGNRNNRMQKIENVHIFIKWTLEYSYNMKFIQACPQTKRLKLTTVLKIAQYVAQ